MTLSESESDESELELDELDELEELELELDELPDEADSDFCGFTGFSFTTGCFFCFGRFGGGNTTGGTKSTFVRDFLRVDLGFAFVDFFAGFSIIFGGFSTFTGFSVLATLAVPNAGSQAVHVGLVKDAEGGEGQPHHRLRKALRPSWGKNDE